MKRGDIYCAALGPARRSDVQKTRPVIIVSNDVANRASSLVTVIPMTSNRTRLYRFEVALETNDTGLGKDGKAMAQQRRTLDKAWLGTLPRGEVTVEKMLLLNAALRLHLALLSFLSAVQRTTPAAADAHLAPTRNGTHLPFLAPEIRPFNAYGAPPCEPLTSGLILL